jgi:hypothetical protein
MHDLALAIMYVATLAFLGFMTWLYIQNKGVDTAIKAEILKMRQEVNALNMAQGMKAQRNVPFGPPPHGA